jgi:RNA polymerase sigma factor (sigma-70 family)
VPSIDTQPLIGQAFVDSLITRDSDTWQRFLVEMGPMLKGICNKSNLDDEEADDIAQVVVLKLLEKDCKALRGLKVDSNRAFFAWVKIVISRTVIDHARSLGLRRERESSAAKEQSVMHADPPGPLLGMAVRSELEKVLAEFSALDRTLFWMDFRDVPDAEMARITGAGVAMVQKRLSRMRKKLNPILGDRWRETDFA